MQDLSALQRQLSNAKATSVALDRLLRSKGVVLKDSRAQLQALQQEKQGLSDNNAKLIARNKELATEVGRASKVQSAQVLLCA